MTQAADWMLALIILNLTTVTQVLNNLITLHQTNNVNNSHIASGI